MRNLFIIAVLAFGMNVTAQTTTNNVLDVRPGTGVNEVKIHNAPVILTGTSKLTAAGGTWTTEAEVQNKLTIYGQTNANGGIVMNGSKITGLRAGSDGNDAVNVNQLNTVRDNLRAENIKAKEESLAYTDTKVKAVNDKLDLEIEANRLAQKRLDDKINSNDEKINQRVKDLEIKIDNRFNAVMSYVGNEFAAVNNRIEGLGAMTVALSAAATSSVYNPNKPTNLNIATGLYGRATAIAVGMSHFFNSSTKVSVNWSQGSNTKNAVGIGAGFAF